MRGSLLLFVVPVDQDFDTILGKVIVSPHADKTIAVLTKVDLLCKQGDAVAKSRLGKIVRDTKQPKVAVLGNLAPGASAEDEARSLASVSDVLAQCGGEILAGCAELGGLIEERMREHLERQLPELHMAVIAARDAKSARKKDLFVREP